MSRWEFLRKLEELLSDISPSEREEALQYYNDYFNDAGKENEDEVMKALGSPEQVAQIVKEGLGDNGSLGEFTENGFSNTEGEKKNEISNRVSSNDTNAGKEENTAQNHGEQTAGSAAAENQKNDMPTWAIVLLVIGCIIFSPAILGVAVACIAAVLSFIIAVFAVVFGIALAAVILLIVAFSLWTAGFGSLFAAPIIGAGLIGGGLICAAFGILLMLLTVFLVGKCIPGIFQGIAYIFHNIFGKKGGKTA